jgi:hypothetical protein
VVGLTREKTFLYSKAGQQWPAHQRFQMEYSKHKTPSRSSIPQYINEILDIGDGVRINIQHEDVPEDDRVYKRLVVDTVITQGYDGVKSLDRIMRDCLHNENGSTLQVCVAYKLLRMDVMRHAVTGQCRVYMPDQMTLYVQSCATPCGTNERETSISVKVFRFVLIPSSDSEKRKMKRDESRDGSRIQTELWSDSDSVHCQSPAHIHVSEKRRFVSQTSNTLRHHT